MKRFQCSPAGMPNACRPTLYLNKLIATNQTVIDEGHLLNSLIKHADP